jgi:hypothetical protein
MSAKSFTLDKTKFDDSDPNAAVYDDEICKVLGVSQQTVNKYLPRKQYPRDKYTGAIRGIKLRTGGAAAGPGPGPVPQAAAAFIFPTPSAQGLGRESAPVEVEAETVSLETVFEELDADEIDIRELATRSKKLKEPINIKDVVQKQYEARIDAHESVSRIAKAYDDLCDPLTYLAKPKKRLKPWFRDDIWLHHVGSLKESKCPCCQIRVISREAFSAGHIQAESRGGVSSIENIVPICDECNGRMGSTHMYWFAWDTYGIVMFKI